MKTIPSKLDSHWNSLSLEDNEAAIWSTEELSIYAQRLRGDWMLAETTNDDPAGKHSVRRTDSLPLGLDWKRWAFQDNVADIRFWPTFPDRPLIVKTRIPVVVPPKSSINLYINIPIWLEVSIAHKDSFETLDKFSPVKLSDTWYGSSFEGQLCYALKSRARRNLDDLENESLRAVCMFRIRNKSDETLPVERIRVIGDHLNLYNIDDRLWASSVDIIFNGKDEKTSVEYQTNAPIESPNSNQIREATKPYRHASFLDKFLFHPFTND
mgnify:CR=1 FL=1